jgi:hypothetical protein
VRDEGSVVMRVLDAQVVTLETSMLRAPACSNLCMARADHVTLYVSGSHGHLASHRLVGNCYIITEASIGSVLCVCACQTVGSLLDDRLAWQRDNISHELSQHHLHSSLPSYTGVLYCTVIHITAMVMARSCFSASIYRTASDCHVCHASVSIMSPQALEIILHPLLTAA